jgi:hypothetical protein
MQTTTVRELDNAEIDTVVGGMALKPGQIPPGSPGPTRPLPPFPVPFVA